MIPMISPQEVIALALPTDSSVTAGNISEVHILATQQRFFVPALGRELFEAITLQRKYPTFTSSYLHTPLALLTIYSTLPQLTIRLGSGGAAVAKPEAHAVATKEHLRDLRRQFRRSGEILLKEAISHLAANEAAYPEFDKSRSVCHRVVSGGGIIIV